MKITLNIIDGFCKKMTRYAVVVKAVAGMEMVVILTLFIFSVVAREEGFLKREKTVIFSSNLVGRFFALRL
ncbi:MAG: hypothetical protein K2M99_00395 [Treponemataceae bacterium]|nr:hypothetical protein [Treponemataceae bacterium]